MGATWDPSAAQAGGEVTANALRATGWNWDFAPVQDLARDNRWGRYYETWAEEPALAAALGAANVRGLQSGGAGGLKVTATVKHFAGYSESINGHDRVQADLPIRYLQDTFLPSYAGAIDAGAGTVMVDSGSVNGIPATASHYLLTTLLRDRMGFKGVVISDYGDVGRSRPPITWPPTWPAQPPSRSTPASTWPCCRSTPISGRPRSSRTWPTTASPWPGSTRPCRGSSR